MFILSRHTPALHFIVGGKTETKIALCITTLALPLSILATPQQDSRVASLTDYYSGMHSRSFVIPRGISIDVWTLWIMDDGPWGTGPTQNTDTGRRMELHAARSVARRRGRKVSLPVGLGSDAPQPVYPVQSADARWRTDPRSQPRDPEGLPGWRTASTIIH